MQQSFDALINSFIDDKIGIAENFLSPRLTSLLKHHLEALYAAAQMKLAGTGNDPIAVQDTAMRSDHIYWLDRTHENAAENEFFDCIDLFITHLNNTCYTGITGYEFHYAMYEAGSFYKPHYDQFRNNDSRKYSMIIYLNTDWQSADGGELCIHHTDHLQLITPVNGKTVFFKSSELLHEVLPANKPRMSITGWLKTG